eukprot:scaffold5200_cov165-Ochromonas_danica.AAC.4
MEWTRETEDDTQTENSDAPPLREPLRADLTSLPGIKYDPLNAPASWSSPATRSPIDCSILDTSQRKRNRQRYNDDNTLDDLVGQITHKLNGMSTGEDSKSISISAFLDVLGCSSEEAEFYLESSMWEIQTAVALWLENNPHPLTSFPKYITQPIIPKYREREVIIAGLPLDWSARVSAADGTIYFVHLPTGERQMSVPPGFADPLPDSLEATTSSNNHCEESTHEKSLIDHVFGTESEYFRVVDDNMAMETFRRWTSEPKEESVQQDAKEMMEEVEAVANLSNRPSSHGSCGSDSDSDVDNERKEEPESTVE